MATKNQIRTEIEAIFDVCRQVRLYLSTILDGLPELTPSQREALLSDLDYARAPAEQLEERLETWGSVIEEENPADDDDDDQVEDDDDQVEDDDDQVEDDDEEEESEEASK